MCNPATLAIAAIVTTVASTGFAAMQSASQNRYQARVADRNVDLANEAAQTEQANTRQAALEHYRKVAQLKGRQRAAMAAGGIDLGFGSAADVQADTDMLAREDTRRLYDQGAERSRGFEIEASNFGGQANASRSAATGALIGGALDIGSTALSGAAQFGKLKGKVGATGGMRKAGSSIASGAKVFG